MRKYPKIEVIGDYVNGTVKIKVRCRKCGKEWETQPKSLMRSKGCKYCQSRRISSQEEFVAVSLEKLYGKGSIIRHNTDIIGKELDIIIKKENIAVEVGDWNYHEKRYLIDKRKKELCEEKGIRLITLYFNVKNKSQRNNEKDIIFLEDNLHDINGKQKAVVEIMQAMGKEINYSQLIWEKINEISLRKARRKAPEEYARELKNFSQILNC